MRVVLASGSPQRKALLQALGVEFEVVRSGVAELSEGDPSELVEANALAKARSVAGESVADVIVIGGDTEVVLDGRVLGQPEDEGQAREFLRRLSGREHEVVGGLAVVGAGEERRGVEVSRVRFREIEEVLLEAYVASGEWERRAGGYAIQGLGSALVDCVRGDLSNVIGLPVPLLGRLAPEVFGAGGRT